MMILTLWIFDVVNNSLPQMSNNLAQLRLYYITQIDYPYLNFFRLHLSQLWLLDHVIVSYFVIKLEVYKSYWKLYFGIKYY